MKKERECECEECKEKVFRKLFDDLTPTEFRVLDWKVRNFGKQEYFRGTIVMGSILLLLLAGFICGMY